MNITGTRLRKLRLNKGYSQSNVAKKIGITRPAYVAYETGRTKPVRKLKELAELFNVSSNYILGIEEKGRTENLPIDLNEIINNSSIFLIDGKKVELDKDMKEKLKLAIKFIFWYDKNKNSDI